jgi:L-fucose isomerase-like protein
MAGFFAPNLRPVPRLGLLINSIDVFSGPDKDSGEKALVDLFGRLQAEGAIDGGSVVSERVMGYHQARKAADQFAAACVDVIVLANIAFPNGHVLVTIATDPHLQGVPIAVVGQPEPAGQEWATNAWCGVIMNNFAAKQLGRPIVTIGGNFTSAEFETELRALLRASGTMKGLRRDFLGRIGEAPGGFHSASGNLLACAELFGTQVDTCDLTAVINAYKTGRASGYLGESIIEEGDIKETVDLLMADRTVSVEPKMIDRGVRMYAAYRAIIRANGYTSVAFRCWPEINEDYIGVSTCLTVSLLLGRGEVTAASCESDWPIAIMQTIGTLMSGRPAACLDWVNDTARSNIVQLGHCGVGICGQMACEPCQAGAGVVDVIDIHPVIRQAGKTMGPVHVGQYAYGVKTGFTLLQERGGAFKMLAFRGESSPETAKGMRYSAADVYVPQYKELGSLILQHGFPHHLIMAQGDILRELSILCTYLGIEFISPTPIG